MSDDTADRSPLIPPLAFVARFNAQPCRAGLPYLTALDPLVMLAWHMASEAALKPGPLLAIAGI